MHILLTLLPTFLIKNIGEYKTYFQLIFPVSSLFFLYKSKFIDKKTYVLFFLAVYSVIYSLVNLDISSLVRISQLCLFIILISQIVYYKPLKSIDIFFKASAIYGILFSFVEFILTKNIFYKTVLYSPINIKIPMLSGLIGEPNYTGFFYFGSIIYFIYTKKYRYIPIALVIILSCASRTFLICSVVSILIYFLSFNLKRLLSYLILYSVISYPILVSLLYQFSDTSFHLLATKITNGRFAIHCVYLDMFLKNPLGVGFFNGAKRFAQQRANEANVFPIHDMDLYISNYQQHSLNFQILSEFGIIGYLLFCYFIFSLHKHVSSYSSKLALLLTLFIFPTMQLNVTNEIIVYLMISLILIYLNTKKKDQLFSKHSH